MDVEESQLHLVGWRESSTNSDRHDLVIQLKTIHEVEAVDFRGEPLIWNQLTALGSLRLSLPDGSSITVAGIREPREVLSAVRLLREFDRATGDCMAY